MNSPLITVHVVQNPLIRQFAYHYQLEQHAQYVTLFVWTHECTPGNRNYLIKRKCGEKG